jgi:hypothetical protein
MKVRGGEFSTGTMGNFQPELTINEKAHPWPSRDGLSEYPSATSRRG